MKSLNRADFQHQVIQIDQGWRFRQAGSRAWLPAEIPGTVHSDLLRNGRIKSPYFGVNERALQWIDKVAWEYETDLYLEAHHLAYRYQKMVFDGLDTYADVWLNGAHILASENMFRRYQVAVSSSLRTGDNRLRIVFASPTLTALEKLKQYGTRLPAVNDQSKIGRMGRNRVSPFIRKAPYHFGWDWGPRLVTSGVWRPIRLQLHDKGVIDELFIKQLEINSTKAVLEAQLTFSGITEPGYWFRIVLPENGRSWKSNGIDPRSKKLSERLLLEVEKPELWYPHGYGWQSLTRFQAQLYQHESLVDAKEETIGLREVQLIRESDVEGKSFYFKVNGIPIFAKGANYIPNDIFTPQVDPAKYDHILQSAVQANMNMLRVWGGGIYECDYFYDACDRLGLTVWQDFMFACSMYPGNPEFLDSVKFEAVDNVKRLRNHACIVLWCGNNEIDLAWSPHHKFGGWGWKQRYTSNKRAMLTNAYDTLFHHMLPEIVASHDGTRAYWPSSPLSDWGESASYTNTSGDMHYWGVWHNNEPFETYGKVKARFMSEYGFQSFPQLSTIYKYTAPKDRFIDSSVMRSHQRCGFGNTKILRYMTTYLPGGDSLAEIVYASQFLQAYGIERAIELHRMRKPYTMGTLFWQLNDCWPVASWSSLDYYGNWKGLHFRVKQAFKPIKLLASISEGGERSVDIWITSDKRQSFKGDLQLQWIDFFGNILWDKKKKICAGFEKTSLAHRFHMAAEDKNIYRRSLLVCRLRSEEQILDSKIIWFEIPKNLELPTVQITSKITRKNGKAIIVLSSSVAAMGIGLDFGDINVTLSDNYFDLLPGETKQVTLSAPEIPLEKIEHAMVLFCINNLKGKIRHSLFSYFSGAAKRKLFRMLKSFRI